MKYDKFFALKKNMLLLSFISFYHWCSDEILVGLQAEESLKYGLNC